MLQQLSTAVVIVCWFVYLPMFIGKRGPGSERIRKERISRLGIVLQFAGVAVIWLLRRPLFSPLVGTGFPLRTVAPIVAVILAAGSVYFSRIALQTLGKQWSF